ncbi:MAG: flagellar export protein FliJ [Deltaproteobacteria bacterium]|nr:flagellar export protein FliJ [Deltaproteobacteria bacterium]MBW2341812.1 flagellar export protein FliJ [Deltaproteobacteria bacterium]
MKKFYFRLDSVLGYRRHLEKKAQRDLVNAHNEQARRKKMAKELRNKRDDISKECSDETFKGIDVSSYRLYTSFLQSLNQDLERAHTSLKQGEERVRDQQEILERKSIEKKSLEILKELQFKDYRRARERSEQKAVDELVIMRRGQKA